MSHDWQVGDLAVCVDDKPTHESSGNWGKLKSGRVYRVIHLAARRDGLCLGLEGINDGSPTRGLRPWRFRKIRPDEHEACEEEFRILLKLSKKRVSA